MPSKTKAYHTEILPRRATPREEFLDWISGMANWTTKYDTTFKFPCDEFRAEKLFRKFMHDHLPSSTYFFAVEQNPNQPDHALGGGLKRPCHIHALTDTPWKHYKLVKRVLRKDIWKLWFEKYGRNRLEPVRNLRDARDYCAKKIFAYSDHRERPGENLRKDQVAWGFAFGEGRQGRQLRDRQKNYVENHGVNIKEEVIEYHLSEDDLSRPSLAEPEKCKI